jgi:hypothetical protein
MFPSRSTNCGIVSNTIVDVGDVFEAFELRREIIRDAIIVRHDALVRNVEINVAAVRARGLFRSFVLNDAFVVLEIRAVFALTCNVTVFTGAPGASDDHRGRRKARKQEHDVSHNRAS